MTRCDKRLDGLIFGVSVANNSSAIFGFVDYTLVPD